MTNGIHEPVAIYDNPSYIYPNYEEKIRKVGIKYQKEE
jgi:hypothetical protein